MPYFINQAIQYLLVFCWGVYWVLVITRARHFSLGQCRRMIFSHKMLMEEVSASKISIAVLNSRYISRYERSGANGERKT